ncbi:MAG TPA: cyclopropane-fatty-acyl-phospholipid synthase family protein [Nitrospira sp.]|nr:cyclopropane-fatty-acyl-phospholipid synthase family protein [Nitrospira sp.]
MERHRRDGRMEQVEAPDMSRSSTIRTAIGLLEGLLRGSDMPNIAIRFWDGSVWRLREDRRPEAMLVLRHEDSLSRLLRFPIQLSAGEAYIYDDIDIVGPIETVLPIADRLIARRWSAMELIRCLAFTWRQRRLRRVPEETRALFLQGRPHEKRRDKDAVRFHYDVPVEFYRLWLDNRLIYSCGYFRSEQDGLEDAQSQKLEYLCRKLRLKPGDRVLDIGCGWGGFAIYASQAHGAIVHGITLSRRQAEVANQTIAARGLSQRCRIEVRDFRDVQGESLYDTIVSIGMIEHVGRTQLGPYYERALRLLAPGGVFLNQGIGTRDGEPKLGPFANRYVFPDAELPPIDEVVSAAERSGFDVRDVESLREHYALTLNAWRQRLEERRTEAVRIVGDVTYRVWRLYLAMAAHYFRRGKLGLYHTLCAKPIDGRTGLPLTREDWYRPFPVSGTQKQAA